MEETEARTTESAGTVEAEVNVSGETVTEETVPEETAPDKKEADQSEQAAYGVRKSGYWISEMAAETSAAISLREDWR